MIQKYVILHAENPSGVGDANAQAESQLLRNDWAQGYTPAEVSSFHNDLAALVPAGARVLDLGCGTGLFYAALNALQPGITYTGVDLSVEAIEEATAAFPGANAWVVGNAFEYLRLADPAGWDFIVSSRSLFDETYLSADRYLLELVDAKSPKGFAMLISSDRSKDSKIQRRLQRALASSTGVVQHHFSGPWDPPLFQGDMTGLSVLHISRTGTSAVSPNASDRWDLVGNRKLDQSRARAFKRKSLKDNTPISEYKTVTQSGGLVTGVDANKAIASAPDQSQLSDDTQKFNFIQNLG